MLRNAVPFFLFKDPVILTPALKALDADPGEDRRHER